MANQQLTVIAKILVKDAQREFVKSELLKLIEPTRAEEGCINYDLHQDNKNPNLFLFFENWTTRDLWQKHIKNDHIVAYQKATEGAIEEFTLHEMTLVD